MCIRDSLKAVCQMGNFIVIFLIHMDYRRLSLRTASPVVQENYIVFGAWTVADEMCIRDSSYFYLDQEGRALRYFEKALEARPDDEDTMQLIDCLLYTSRCV